ncbi:Protein DCL chloroplastic [Bienertia sinuspersici]
MSILSSLHSCSTCTLPPRHNTSSNSCLLGTFISSSSSILSLPSVFHHQKQQQNRCCCAIKTGSHDAFGPDLLKKPVISSPSSEENDDGTEQFERVDDYERGSEGERWVDWEDQILEDTVPLVGFVRMILHSGKYQCGGRLSAEHEKTILEKLLPFHPECDKKIGCGVDYITVGYHPQFQDSRCLFIVRKDGGLVDFSYWKCIKGFIRKNYPLYADSFILKHFRRRRRYE